jgi:hypothetical protein
MLQDHDSDESRRLPVEDQVRKGGEAAASVAPLIEIKGKMTRVIFDESHSGPEFRLESVGNFRSGFRLVVGEDLIEVLLNERMEG